MYFTNIIKKCEKSSEKLRFDYLSVYGRIYITIYYKIGRSAVPQYPLTPAAVFLPPEEGAVREENAVEAEQVDRIRNNLRETRTVSSSLLRVLMP